MSNACLILFLALFQDCCCWTSGNPMNVTQFQSCACDMTSGSCDVYCCCDEDCMTFDKESFECRDNDILKSSHLHNRCEDVQDGPEKGFLQLLCLYKENTPYLGHYFTDFPPIRDLPALNDLLSRKIDSHSIENGLTSEIDNRHIDFGLENGYIYGQELVVLSKRFKTSSLRVPYSLYGRTCDSYRLVRYLEDTQSTCSSDIQSECFSLSNTQSLLISHDGQKLLGAPHDGTPIQDVTVEYFRIPDGCYLYGRDHTGNVDANCTMEPLGYIPKSNGRDSSCFNIVMEANYVFYWAGGRINKTDVQIILGNVSAERNKVLHKFSVSFKHLNAIVGADMYRHEILSLGYKISDEVLGYEDVQFDDNVNASRTKLFTWAGGADGSCQVGSIPVKFGVERLSGCTFTIAKWSAVECSRLRSDVREIQMAVLNASSLDTKGRSNGSSVVEIIDEDMEPENRSESARYGCSGVPHQVALEIVYAEIGSDHGTPLYQILKAVRRYYTISWYSDGLDAAVHYPLYSSVHFQEVSLEEMERRKRTKRSKLAAPHPDQCLEETCWREVLYPLVSSDFKGDLLSAIINILFLVTVMLGSVMFLLSTRRQKKR